MLVVAATTLLFAVAPAARAAIRVHPPTSHFLADDGRVVIMHGGNAVVKVPPYLPDRTTWSWNMSLTHDDFRLLHGLGMNAIRLGVMWVGIETSPGVVNASYLAAIRGLLDDAAEEGIHVLLGWCHAPGSLRGEGQPGARFASVPQQAPLPPHRSTDMHQDAMSPRFCGEGFPEFYVAFNHSLPAFPSPDFWINITVDPTTGMPPPSQCAQQQRVGQLLGQRNVIGRMGGGVARGRRGRG